MMINEDKLDLESLKFLKNVLMVSVIFGHSIAFWSGKWFTHNPICKSDFLKYTYMYINNIHVYSFTLVSGYIFNYKMRKGDYNNFTRFVNKKIKRLLIPYIFCAIFWVIPITRIFFNLSEKEIFMTYILCINPSQLWFLWMLFGVFIIQWPLWKLTSKNRKMGIMINSFFYILGYLGNILLPNIFCIWTSFKFCIFFYLGILMCESKIDERKLIGEHKYFGGLIFLNILLFILLSITGVKESKYIILFNKFIEILFQITGSIMAFYLLKSLAKKFRWERSVLFNKLYVYNMPIYLFHQQIIYLTIYLLNGLLNPILHSFINFIISIFISYLITSVLIRNRYTSILIGV